VAGLAAERLPRPAVSEPGLGKSGLALHLAKLFAFGGAWPDGNAGRAARPHAAGGDGGGAGALRRPRAEVGRPGAVPPHPAAARRPDRRHPAGRPGASGAHQRTAARPGDALLLVDSLSGGHTRDENMAETGEIVRVLAHLAAEADKPLLLLHHLNKSHGLSPAITLDRVRGTAASRSTRAWCGRWTAPTRRSPPRCAWASSSPTWRPPRTRWGWPSPTPACTSPPSSPARRAPPPCSRRRKAFLLESLAGGTPVWQSDIEEAAGQRGVSLITMRRAKRELGVVCKKDGAKGRWYWLLPAEDE